jgi:ferrochelatase
LPCLNERDDWIRALADVALRHLAGWMLESGNPQLEKTRAEDSRTRALARGADV